MARSRKPLSNIEGLKPWERLNDTDKSWEAFVVYRDMGTNRSIEKVAKQLGFKKRRVMYGWSYQHRWKDRARAYDNELDRVIREAKEQEMAKLSAQAGKRYAVTVDRTREELARLAFSDLRDVASWGPNGSSLKPSNSLRPEAAAIVKEVYSIATKNGQVTKLKIYDKVDALTQLGRHLGMFVDKLEIGMDKELLDLLQAIRGVDSVETIEAEYSRQIIEDRGGD